VATEEEFAERLVSLRQTRARLPELVRNRFASRHRRSVTGHTGRLLLIEVDGPMTGDLGVGADVGALADRGELLRRLVDALGHRGVDGVIAPADVIDDLLLLEALEDELAIGTITSGGFGRPASAWDGRFTGYDTDSIAVSRLDGGRLALRIDPADIHSAVELERCARTVTALSGHSVLAILEPIWAGTGTAQGTQAMVAEQIRAVCIASALGARTSYSWLALPVGADFAELVAATTLPVLVHVGEATGWNIDGWADSLAVPGVRGMVLPVSLLFATAGDDPDPLDSIARLVHEGAETPG